MDEKDRQIEELKKEIYSLREKNLELQQKNLELQGDLSSEKAKKKTWSDPSNVCI
jgi:regulator of replication initiation timing